MSEALDPTTLGSSRQPLSLTTPTGLQSVDDLSQRRRVVMVLNIATYLAMLWLAARVLGAGGWSLVDAILFVGFALGTPWTVLGFWNAVIGLWLLHFHKDPITAVAYPQTYASVALHSGIHSGQAVQGF